MINKRITITLPDHIIEETKRVSGGNVSRYVGEALERSLDERRRQTIREELIAGCIANAEEDLLIC